MTKDKMNEENKKCPNCGGKLYHPRHHFFEEKCYCLKCKGCDFFSKTGIFESPQPNQEGTEKMKPKDK